MPPFVNWKKYLHLTEESTWGTYASGGTHLYVPYTSYSVGIQETFQQADLHTGFRQRKHNRKVSQAVQGGIAMPLWAQHISSKSIAQHIMEWALSAPNDDELDSFTAEKFEDGIDNKRHAGLRINTMTISGQGNGPINMSLDVIGQSEAGGVTVESLPTDQPMPIEFLMSDASLAYEVEETSSASVGGDGNSLQIASFSLTLQNTLIPVYLNSLNIVHLLAGVRLVDFNVGIIKQSNTYDAIRRDNNVVIHNAVLQLKGRHGGSGASGDFTVCDIDLDRLNVAQVTDPEGDRNSIAMQDIAQLALKPDSTQNDIDVSWSLE